MALDPYLLREFGARCQIAFDLCVLHKEMFDRNTQDGHMKNEPFYSIFGCINNATLEHSLLQIVKLHDPISSKVRGNIKSNLGIAYVLEQGEWTQEVYDELASYRNDMNKLYQCIKNARDWAFCHNDVASILAKETLGAFEKDADEPYFEAMEKFLRLAYKQLLHEEFSFQRYLKEDIALFISHFNRS